MASPEETGTAAPQVCRLWFYCKALTDGRFQVPEAIQRLLPKIVWPSGEAYNDSTFLIHRLEREFRGRSVRPSEPALAWVCDLIEDWA